MGRLTATSRSPNVDAFLVNAFLANIVESPFVHAERIDTATHPHIESLLRH
jgi:hypothetical protein